MWWGEKPVSRENESTRHQYTLRNGLYEYPAALPPVPCSCTSFAPAARRPLASPVWHRAKLRNCKENNRTGACVAPRPAQRCCPYTDVTVGSHRAPASAPGYSVLARLLRQPGAAGARFSLESARPREGSALMIMMSAREMYGSGNYGREQHLGACRNRDQRAEHRVLAPQRNGVSRGALESLSYVLRFITEVSSRTSDPLSRQTSRGVTEESSAISKQLSRWS